MENTKVSQTDDTKMSQTDDTKMSQTDDTQITDIVEDITAVKNIVKDIISDEPEPSENSIKFEKINEPVDKNGDIFNCEIHKTDENNQPIILKSGKLKLLRKKTLKLVNEKINEEINEKIDYTATGKVLAELYLNISCGIQGQDYLPIKNNETDERAVLYAAFISYCETKELSELPPAWLLVSAIGSHQIKRVFMPTQQSKIKRIKLWYVKKIKKWREKRGIFIHDKKDENDKRNDIDES